MKKENYNEWRNEYRQSKRQKYYNLLGGKCERCGSKKNLHFDHKNPKKKKFRIADNIDAPEDILLAEVKKCRLLCKKCHIQKTKEKNEHGQPKSRHGTVHKYNKGCRCKKCTTAKTTYMKELRKKKLKEIISSFNPDFLLK